MKPIIETERLVLREVDIEADIDAWQDMMSDSDTVRYIGNQTMTRMQTWRYMATVIGHYKIRGYGFMSVIEKATGQWIGRIGPWYPEGWVAPEVGWAIHKDFTRQGFAKEAARACVDYAFDTLGWEYVIHVIADGNIGSIKTAEAIGSAYERSIDGLPGLIDLPCHIYSQKRRAI